MLLKEAKLFHLEKIPFQIIRPWHANPLPKRWKLKRKISTALPGAKVDVSIKIPLILFRVLGNPAEYVFKNLRNSAASNQQFSPTVTSS